jgi:hypothetical protein
MLGPIVHGVVSTVVAMAIVGTGAFFERVETSRTMAQLSVYKMAFESPSQRVEPERRYDGYMRVLDGEWRDMTLVLGTDRGTVEAPRFSRAGAPANVALHVDAGRPFRIMVADDEDVLRERPAGELATVTVEGRMLARGGALLGAALSRGPAGDLTGRLALVALLALAALGAAGLGMGAARSLGPAAPAWQRIGAALLGPAGLVVGGLGVAPWLGAAGAALAALVVSCVAVAVLSKAGEIRKLVE